MVDLKRVLIMEQLCEWIKWDDIISKLKCTEKFPLGLKTLLSSLLLSLPNDTSLSKSLKTSGFSFFTSRDEDHALFLALQESFWVQQISSIEFLWRSLTGMKMSPRFYTAPHDYTPHGCPECLCFGLEKAAGVNVLYETLIWTSRNHTKKISFSYAVLCLFINSVSFSPVRLNWLVFLSIALQAS